MDRRSPLECLAQHFYVLILETRVVFDDCILGFPEKALNAEVKESNESNDDYYHELIFWDEEYGDDQDDHVFEYL